MVVSTNLTSNNKSIQSIHPQERICLVVVRINYPYINTIVKMPKIVEENKNNYSISDSYSRVYSVQIIPGNFLLDYE